jgi:molybdenum cofactor guanylyltransferase
MGGQPKGLVELAGKPMIQHLIEKFAQHCQQTVINANDHISEYQRFGFPVIADSVPGYQGPLAGMLAGMQYAKTNFVLFVPCDTPNLPQRLPASLLAAMQEDTDISVAGIGTKLQPVVALARTSLVQSLGDALNRGERKTANWITSQSHIVVDFSDEQDGFQNINTTAELKNLKVF